MATYDEDRPNVATGAGRVPTKKQKKKPSKPAKRSTGGYDWGDGNKVHSISRESHDANVKAKAAYGINAQTPLDAPLTSGQAYAMAEAAANRTYKPQLDANQQLQVNTPAWYQNYITRTGDAQKAAQQQAAPILSTAQQAVTNAGATAPGLDPSSPQYAKEQQAAQGRQTMAQDSANYLAGVAAATNAYFGGQANIAQRELPQVQAGLLQQYGQLGSQRADAVTQEYGNIRSGEQNASIARSTLGLNTASAAADVDLKRGVDPVTGKALPKDAPTGYAPGGPGQNKYGYTYDEWSALPEGKKNAARNPKPKTGTDKVAKDREKKKGAIKKATGSTKVEVGSIISKWDGYKGQQTDDTSKPKDPKTGEYPARPLAPSDIKRILGEKHDPQMIHVALLVRAGKPLDQSAIDYLHSKDPNIRIPREWLRGKQKPSAPLNRPNRPKAPKNAPAGYGDQYGGT
jgi:hypothetical protein